MKKITLIASFLLATIGINAQIVLTQNTSNTITGTNSVGCPNGDNVWARNFVLSNFSVNPAEDFIIASGAFGVQSSAVTATSVTVSVYTSNTTFPASFSESNLIGSQVVPVPASTTEAVISYDFTTPIVVPAGTIAVLYTVSTIAGNNFFIGGSAGQTTGGFLKSVQCGVTTFTTPSAIGFPDANFHLTLTQEDGLGLEKNELASSLSLFPNPTTADLNIKFSKNLGTATVDITTLNGQKVITTTIDANNTQTINTNNLSSGVYFAKISTSDATTTLKFIKN